MADPKVKMTMEEIVKFDGYQFESYDVTTDDGYILQLHRVNSPDKDHTKSKKPVVFL